MPHITPVHPGPVGRSWFVAGWIKPTRADQFLALSTILPAEIHGIMARRVSPTFSI